MEIGAYSSLGFATNCRVGNYYQHQMRSSFSRGFWGEFAGGAAVEYGRRRDQTPRSMADNPSDPQMLCFWHPPRLAVSSVGLRTLW
eukprot:1154640-Pelagomonas_calceolata.AAC.2